MEDVTSNKIQKLVESKNMVIFTCTFYKNLSDLRLQQCLKTIEHPAHGATALPIVIVDGSPDEIHEYIKSRVGSIAIVRKEEGSFGKGKGGALREAAYVASNLPGVTDSTWLCWQEAEKSDMMRCWHTEIYPCLQLKNQASSPNNPSNSMIVKNDDVVICPTREDNSFQKTYPIEQYHSETFGNYYLNCVMKEAYKKEEYQSVYNDIDWHFGPFAFRRKVLHLWMKYKGNSYDAQMVPIVIAIRKGYHIRSDIEVSFCLDENMKQQEEENLNFIEKRLYQLNDFDPKVKQSWNDPIND